MTKVQITLIILLFSLLIGYFILNKNQPQKDTSKKVITIPQLNIITKEKKEPKKEDSSEAILSKLKVAVKTAKEKAILSKEEEATAILATLKAHTKELKPQIVETIKKPKKSIEKQTIAKKSRPQKVVIKKVKPKKVKPQKPKIKKPKVKKVIAKKVKLEKKVITKQSVNKKVSTPIVAKTIAIKTDSINTQQRKLSREEEVALYKKQHKNGLEIIDESKPFTIEGSKPIAKSSKPIVIKESIDKEPIGFVKTLGVVEVSNAYEVNNVEIPKKVEVAKEGIVDMHSASVETEDLKGLKFVKPIELIEVSPEFETIEADKYIK